MVVGMQIDIQHMPRHGFRSLDWQGGLHDSGFELVFLIGWILKQVGYK